MDTKLKGDIAEQTVVLYALNQNWGVLQLIGENVFYVLPSEVFISYGSEIHLVETTKRQRKPKSAAYRNAWDLILQRAAQTEMSE